MAARDNEKSEEKKYDVFLSHSSEDKASVEQLAAHLVDDEGLEPFLDKWHLVPGEPIQEALERELGRSVTCAVFFGPNGRGPWHNEEMRAALDMGVKDKAFRVIPVLLPGASDGDLPALFRGRLWIDFRNGINDQEEFRRFVKGIRGEAPGRAPVKESRDTAEAGTVVVISGEGKRYACLIGTDEYEDEAALPPLPYPTTNVDALTQRLENRRSSDFEPAIVLKNRTHTDIIKEIKRLTGRLKQEDLLLIYFSGYAILDDEDEETADIYLAVAGTETADVPTSAVPLKRIKTFLDKCAAVQKILILDCEYQNDPAAVTAQLAVRAKGKYLISNAPVSERPATNQEGPSPLTRYLVEGLYTERRPNLENPRPANNVTVADWYAYARRHMAEDGLPAPLQWAEGVVGNWIVARAASGGNEAAAVPASLQRDYKDIGEMFRDGLVIPFLGAGAVTEEEEDLDLLPLERDLAEGMAKLAEAPESEQAGSLTMLAQYCQTHMRGGRPQFYEALKRLFPTTARPGPVHRFLAQQQKPMLIVTACYDNLLEDALREKGKPYVVVTHVSYAEDEENLGKVVVQYSKCRDAVEIALSDELEINLAEWWVIYKIQGTFNLTVKKLGTPDEVDSIVIAEEDYIAFVSRLSDQHRTVPTLFNRPFQRGAFLFLGYRMNDWNFRTLVHILLKQKMRKFEGYALRRNVSDFERQYWESKNVRIIAKGVAEFIKELAAEMGVEI